MGSLTTNMGEESQPSLTSKISTVVPATPRGNERGKYNLGYMDLLMKLHYVRTVHFFSPQAAQGLSIFDLKKPMFPLLDPYSHISGRIRRSESSGRPFIKCNDAGVRIVESHCDKTLEEWFNQKGYSIHELVHDHVLGPDLAFSPLLFLKFTWFKCGGLCVGLSWSHVLGDAFSAFNFITKWSHALAGHVPPKSLHVNPNYEELQSLPINSIQDSQIPIVKRATILDEERWIAATDTKIVTHTFYVSYNQLQDSVTSSQESNNTCCFEIVSALVWKCLAQIRSYSEPKDVVICEYHSENYEFPTNIGLEFSTVEASSKVSVSESDVLELATLIGSEKKKVEKHVMEKLVEESEGREDFIVYGTRLTFVNLEEEGNVIYGVKLINGEKPMVANCALHGVGDEGVVLVLPAPQDKEDGGKIGRLVTVSLPEKEVEQLKDKLGSEWAIPSHP
ncbi:hypothetical protein HN51_026097 [Arachis hypogaea]|uniref:Protein ECERIFERUM n=1 Tax=Arachis hypogaea TaxID=3818 RepID=A0A445CGI8_ARAHY|nr:protein ECERIFERUM 2 [Arachis hypogaea]QHO28619.1 Protein ECERIFERUM [Arachis hypogaea]RYR50041.1 hypothetical protein Ahy_A07g036588 [Arachis hypogaea]